MFENLHNIYLSSKIHLGTTQAELRFCVCIIIIFFFFIYIANWKLRSGNVLKHFVQVFAKANFYNTSVGERAAHSFVRSALTTSIRSQTKKKNIYIFYI